MKHATLRRSLILAGACTLGFLIALIAAQPAMAQDGGPECPSGFVWQRMSGVGCVQENCFGVANAKLSYTSACICLDGYKGCYEPVDSSGVECGPFCPVSQLVGCVGPDALCPGEQPAGEQPVGDQPVGEEPENATGPDTAATTDGDAPASDDRTPTVSVDNLVKDLEEFLAGKGVSGPTPGKAAAAGAALSTLIGTWVLVNAASGANIADLLRAVQRWRFGPSTSAPPGTPAPAGTKQASSPAIPLSTSGSVPTQKPGAQAPAGAGAAGTAPPTAVSKKPPASTEAAKPGVVPEADPTLVGALEQRFRQMVAQKLNEGYYVRNTDVVRKAWNQTIGRLSDVISGHKGGQCGDFADWGKQWSGPMVRDLFGDGAIIDTIYVGERSSRVPDGLLDRVDGIYEANHAATRVILPTGESYVLDYWAAVGDQQMKMGTDAAYDVIFGGGAPRDQIRLIPEKEWIQTWKPAMGVDEGEVHNLSYAQQQLKSNLRVYETEELAFQAWRDTELRGVPDHQTETVINNWKKNGVWWER